MGRCCAGASESMLKIYNRVSTKGLAAEPEARLQSTGIRMPWCTHLQGCLRRDIVSMLTIGQFAALVTHDCHWCGAKSKI